MLIKMMGLAQYHGRLHDNELQENINTQNNNSNLIDSLTQALM